MRWIGYIIIHDGKEYDFDLLAPNQEILKDAEQILSTFRFVE